MSQCEVYVALLLNGTDGHLVMDVLRLHYRTLASLDTQSSLVRQAVINHGRSPEYDDTALRRYDNEIAVQVFLKAPLKEQCAIRRSYLWKEPAFSAGAAAELLKIQLLPRSLETFHLTPAEMVGLKRKKDEALLLKNESLIHIMDAAVLLHIAIKWLEKATPYCSDAQLVLPLLLVSGRRSSELCNGKSKFFPSALGPTYCVFDGQLKKKSDGAVLPYTIPLLVDYSLFKRGLDAWLDKHGVRDASHSNRVVAARYSANLRRDRLKVFPLPKIGRVHDLRSMYIQYVWRCYQDISFTFARLAMYWLGHSTMAESLSYSNVQLLNVECIKFGKLLL